MASQDKKRGSDQGDDTTEDKKRESDQGDDTTEDKKRESDQGDGTITPTCLGEICVKTLEDKKRCIISSMTMMSPDKLVLADAGNNSIKLVDVNSKSIISQLSLGTKDEDRPTSITSTSSSHIAVTVSLRQHIQFISVSNDKLSKSQTIQTNGECVGLYCHQDKLIVTFVEPGKLEILDMTGNVIKSLTTDSTGVDIFTTSAFVQANNNSIYVTETEPNMIIILNWAGEITGRITDIECPVGHTVLPDGSLVVCDIAGDRVYQVAGDGTYSRSILQGVTRPWVVCVDNTRHKLYISRYTKEDNLANNILVYNM